MDHGIITDSELLARVERFIAQHSLSPTAFGRLAIGDGNLVFDLGKGRSLTLKRAKKVCDFMSEYSRKLPTEPAAKKRYAKRSKAEVA